MRFNAHMVHLFREMILKLYTQMKMHLTRFAPSILSSLISSQVSHFVILLPAVTGDNDRA